MAVTTNKVQSTLAIHFKTGVSTAGKDIVKSQRYTKVKLDASDDNLYAVAQALGELLNYPVTEVRREDQSTMLSL